MDEQTVFNVASVTKSFTATLLGMLLKENGYSTIRFIVKY